MKNSSFIGQVIISLLLVIFIALCFNPFQELLMPTMFSSMVLIGLVVTFMIFAIFIWREKSEDEREDQHRLAASRAGFLVGAGLLVIGIIVQTINHDIDEWLLIALSGMILSKLLTRLYNQVQN